MQQSVYNPQKGWLETIDIDFTDETQLGLTNAKIAMVSSR